jgi:hypothetical protein
LIKLVKKKSTPILQLMKSLVKFLNNNRED